ncbi:P-loop NTPase family protein [Thermococcus siculi]|nr:hypothetical protein [Thermococcus siculi]
MFERMKPQTEIKAREIEIDFFEDGPDSPERPKVKLLFEIKRYHIA